jgi:hypothetical protein
MSQRPGSEFIVDVTVFTADGEPLDFEKRTVARTAEQAAHQVAQHMAERHRRPTEDVIINRVIPR